MPLETRTAYLGPNGNLYDTAREAVEAFIADELEQKYAFSKDLSGRSKQYILDDLEGVYKVFRKHMKKLEGDS